MQNAEEELVKFIKQRFEYLQGQLAAGNEIVPELYFFMYYDGKQVFSGLEVPYPAVENINYAYSVVKNVAAEKEFGYQLIAVVEITNAWYLVMSEEDLQKPEGLPIPSKDPNKKEMIVAGI